MKLVLTALAVVIVNAGAATATSSDHERLCCYQSHKATVYSGPCDGQTNHMGDGTYIRRDGTLWRHHHKVDIHAIASSFLPRHKWIKFDHRIYGTRYWFTRDGGGAFDLYRPNCHYSWHGKNWNNPYLHFHIVIHR